jgi:hypothetical protein
MALKKARTEHTRTVGHVSHEAQLRVDERVRQILARRAAALRQARLAARRLKRP